MKLDKKLIRFLRKTGQILKSYDWHKDLPHFGGVAPHRYQAFASEYVSMTNQVDIKVCVYCLRPESLGKGKI